MALDGRSAAGGKIDKGSAGALPHAICRTLCTCQLDFGVVIDLLSAQGYDDAQLDRLGTYVSLDDDTISVEQLAAAGVPNRVVFELRRQLDPLAEAHRSATEVWIGSLGDG